MAERQWTKSAQVPEGRHLGHILMCEIKKQSFKGKEIEYLDIKIVVDDVENGPELTYGVPNVAKITDTSKLGRVLIACGAKFEDGGKIDPEVFLKDKKISFMVVKTPGKKDPTKEYANIVENSIKLQQ